MKKITDIISISELSRLIGISRPTLYKYLDEYETGTIVDLPNDIKELFDYAISDEAILKSQIYNYCMNQYKSDKDKSILDRIKVLIENEDYKELFQLIANNTDKIDVNELKEILKEKIK